MGWTTMEMWRAIQENPLSINQELLWAFFHWRTYGGVIHELYTIKPLLWALQCTAPYNWNESAPFKFPAQLRFNKWIPSNQEPLWALFHWRTHGGVIHELYAIKPRLWAL